MTTMYTKELSDATGALAVTQLFPDSCTVGSGATTAGTERRKPTDGTLYRLEVYPSGAAAGTIEIFDVAGLQEGATNNVDTGETLTNAYVTAEIAAGRGRKIWHQTIAGSAGGGKVMVGLPASIMRGLAARWIDAAGGGKKCILNINVDGTFYKSHISG